MLPLLENSSKSSHVSDRDMPIMSFIPIVGPDNMSSISEVTEAVNVHCE